MPIDSHLAATALGVINTAFSATKSAFELAKKSQDRELKAEVIEVFNQMLDLKSTVYELAEENKNLREELALKAKVTLSGPHGYAFAEGDPNPICPKCWEGNNKLCHLSPLGKLSGDMRRKCLQCDYHCWEEKPSQQFKVNASRRGWQNG
jgi:hypothetical protein